MKKVKVKNVNDAMITIKSLRKDENDRDVTEVITEGQLKASGEDFEIIYSETDATGYEGSVTHIRLTGGSVLEMTRTGSVNSELLLETGRKNHCLYGTPFGELTVGVMAKEIKSDMSSEGGHIFASYVLDINSVYAGDYEIDIDVRKI